MKNVLREQKDQFWDCRTTPQNLKAELCTWTLQTNSTSLQLQNGSGLDRRSEELPNPPR